MGKLGEGVAPDTDPFGDRVAELEELIHDLRGRNRSLENELRGLRENAASDAGPADATHLAHKLREKKQRLSLVKRKLREKMAQVECTDDLTLQLASARNGLDDEDSVVDFADAADESDAVAVLQAEVERLKEKVRSADRMTSQLISARRRVAELERKVLDDGSTQRLMKELREQNRQLSQALEQSRGKIRKLQDELLEKMSTRPQ
jgi:hypothetical protein